MVKKIEKLFKSYREQLLHLAKLYGVVEIRSYKRSSKRSFHRLLGQSTLTLLRLGSTI